MRKVSLTTIIVFAGVASCLYLGLGYAKSPQPVRGAASTLFTYSPPVESVKFRHPAFTTIVCYTRSGLTLDEPPSAGTVTGFSTAPFARIVKCESDQPMVEIP